jgi:hypothetical protein
MSPPSDIYTDGHTNSESWKKLLLNTLEDKCPSFERFVEFVTEMDRTTRRKRAKK